MPCRDDGPHYTAEEQQIIDLQKRLDKATQLLCYVCGNNVGYFNTNDLYETPKLKKHFTEEPQLRRWWKNHYECDLKRVLEEFTHQWGVWVASQEVTLESLDPDDVDKQTRKIVKRAIEQAEREHPLSAFHREWFERVAKLAMSLSIKKLVTEADKKRRKAELLASLTKEERELLKG